MVEVVVAMLVEILKVGVRPEGADVGGDSGIGWL